MNGYAYSRITLQVGQKPEKEDVCRNSFQVLLESRQGTHFKNKKQVNLLKFSSFKQEN